MKVKMCGLRRPEEIQLAAELGVTAIGFVLYPPSKRALSLVEALQLKAYIPPHLKLVVLLVNPTENEVHQVIQELAPDILQFHGDESAGFCEQFNYPYWRAVRVGAPNLTSTEEIQQFIQQYPHAKGFLFDAYSHHYGGAGIRFDMKLLDGIVLHDQEMIIAGGINADNVRELIGRCEFIDLSSGIEEQAGIKSLAKMSKFMKILKNHTSKTKK